MKTPPQCVSGGQVGRPAFYAHLAVARQQPLLLLAEVRGSQLKQRIYIRSRVLEHNANNVQLSIDSHLPKQEPGRAQTEFKKKKKKRIDAVK